MVIIPVITIDGPSGVGKSTLCRLMAKIFQWHILDSGIIYRIIALLALRHHVNLISEEEILKIVAIMSLDIYHLSVDNDHKIIFKGENIKDKIYTQEVTNVAFRIAAFPRVRKILLHYQRAFCKSPGLIANGRDMGTVIFPNAQFKFFLDASLEERANRRLLQLQKRNYNVNFNHLISNMKERDDQDINRDIAPLVPAEDALILNSTNLTIKQVVEKALHYVRHKSSY